jgi:predicted RNA-binding Zn-ribbon protein involved in translation (DUF1610 family)
MLTFAQERGGNMDNEKRHICPKCGKNGSIRIKRKKWMRHIPYIKLYDCQNCGCEYIVFLKFFKMTTFCLKN